MTSSLAVSKLEDTRATSGGGAERRLRYVYVSSVEHSGSTLLACLLGAHPDVSTVGEFGTVFPKSGICSCGVSYQSCSFWKTWQSKAEQAGIPFEIGNLSIFPMLASTSFQQDLLYHLFPNRIIDRFRDILFLNNRYRREIDSAAEKAARLAQILCDIQGTSTFVDTTKMPLMIRFLSARPEIDFRLIAMVRDGRGVMKSVIEKEKYSPEQAVGAWLWGNRNLRRASAYVQPENVLWLRLEDLCGNPDQTVSRIQRFCGLDESASLDFSPTTRHVVGNGMRLKFNGQIRHDESWRDYLTSEHLALFEKRAGRINRKLGYS